VTLTLALGAILVGYLPGALLYRLPVAARTRRAALGADERVFWSVVLSLSWSLTVVLVLAALDRYQFSRLLWMNGVACAAFVVAGRERLRFGRDAPRPTWTALLPLILIALGMWRFFPPSEYILGGKDPGTYMNEGIQIAQRGAIVTHDPVVAAVPAFARDLFFPSYGREEYYSTRFMGFFLQDPATGAVVGQFPHLFPASIAIGYGLNGLSGARETIGVWATLGLLSLYFAGARLVGRAPALAGAILLSLNVTQVWFGRYPNAELPMQALLFAALLAFARCHQDDDGFFAPVAGWLTALLLFLRLDAAVPIGAMLGAGVLAWIVDGRRIRGGFAVVFVAGAIAAWFYLTGPIRAYFALPAGFVSDVSALTATVGVATALGALVALAWLAHRRHDLAHRLIAVTLVAAVVGLSVYAWFFRVPTGRLADFDAYALRDFTHFYLGRPSWLGPIVLVVAIAGFAMMVRGAFWRDPALLLTFAAFSICYFYKMRIVPEHFWAARRFLPITLPGLLVAAAFAAIGRARVGPGVWPRARVAAGALFLAVVGWQYAVAAAPVMPHVEYAGVIPYLEHLAARFGDRDLVIVESRNASSDTHVMAVPLADIYARNVLVLNSPRPDKAMLRAFLEDALTRYARVFFVGGGGTDLLSRHIVARAVADERLRTPEYESARNAYPTGIHRKDFEYSVYQLTVGDATSTPFVLDVGDRDDLNVLRFNAKEASEGRTVRWTGPQSFVAIPGLTGAEREVVLVMHDGGRPANADPARVTVFLDDVLLGSTDVRPGFQPYRFVIPADLAARLATLDEPAQLRLVSTTWNPQTLLGGPDDRTLGVMLDRVEVH
jgi:hypothetical protein